MRQPLVVPEAQQKRRSRWALSVALSALLALFATAGWAGYRMLDPVANAGHLDNETCHSTGAAGSSPGIYTTPYLELKPGQAMRVESVELVGVRNYGLAGVGVQNHTRGIGALGYPVADDGSPEAAAWLTRTQLPAELTDGPNEALVMALMPIDPTVESRLEAISVSYSNDWGLKYRVEVGPSFVARADCLAETPTGD